MSEEGLKNHRQKIDDLDKKLVTLLAERMAIVSEVAHYKHEHNIPIVLEKRIEQVCENVTTLGKPHGLNDTFVKDLWLRMIKEACRIEQQIFDENA